jgi:hypothetical protein
MSLLQAVNPSTLGAVTKIAGEISGLSQSVLTPVSTLVVGYVAVVSSKMSKRIKTIEKTNTDDHEHFRTFISSATNIVEELKSERNIYIAIDAIIKNGLATIKMIEAEYNETICQLLADMGMVTKSFSTQLSQSDLTKITKHEVAALYDAHAYLMRTKYEMLPEAFIQSFRPSFVRRGKEYSISVTTIITDGLNAKNDRFRIETEKFLSDLVTILLKKYFAFFKSAN